MKNNEEKILRYLSEMMTEKERAEFENQVSVLPELKEEFDAINGKLSEFKLTDGLLDERYFAALLPKVRLRAEKLNGSSFLKKIYYLVPTAAAALVGVMFLFKPAYTFDTHYKQLANQVVNNFSDQEVSRKYFDETDCDPAVMEVTDDSNDLSSLVPSSVELNDEIASKYLNGSVVEDYSALHGLSDTELQQIADNLNSIKVK